MEKNFSDESRFYLVFYILECKIETSRMKEVEYCDLLILLKKAMSFALSTNIQQLFNRYLS
jgi:hypothetical protein